MKQILLFPFIYLLFAAGYPSEPMIPDPSAVYCKFLGYEIAVRKDPQGNEYGVCIFPDGSECDTWAFFRGSCGKPFSYCSKKGCETLSIKEDKGSYEVTYCACGCLDSSGHKKIIPLMQFMEEHGDTLIKQKPDRFLKGK